MPTEKPGNIHDLFEDRARSGDAIFAVAYALLELAQANRAAAQALDRLGLNYGSDMGPPGALEELSMQASQLARAADRIANALEGRAE